MIIALPARRHRAPAFDPTDHGWSSDQLKDQGNANQAAALRLATNPLHRFCPPYRAFRRPLSVGLGRGSFLLQYLLEYLAGLTFFRGRAVPHEVLPLVATGSIQFSTSRAGVLETGPVRWQSMRSAVCRARRL